jgi:Uma2 family endonuclease
MHMALGTRPWTRADLERLPDDTNKYELVRGELLVSAMARPAHGYIKQEVRIRLEAYCIQERIGRVFEESGYALDESETIPDILVRERVLPPPDRCDDLPMPLLVVEVISESTRRNDEVKKRAFYMESGIPEYWIVDGKARTIRVITSTGDRVESTTLRWSPPGASKPLDIDIQDLFNEAIGLQPS